MDSAMKLAIMKYRAPKQRPSKELSPLQVKLKNNPYAQALSTPVRKCIILKAALPSFFLTRFNVAAHPETEALWYLPQDLTKSPPRPRDAGSPQGPSLPIGPSGYILSSASLIKLITLAPTKRRHFNWKQLNDLQGAKANFVWRQDMHEFVLRLLQRRVHDEAKYLAVRRCFSSCATLDDIQSKRQVGFVLWFGRPMGRRNDAPVDETDAGPASYATIAVQHPATEAAFYNLPRLLGHELTDALRRDFKLEPHNEVVAVKSKRPAVNAGTWLWKLEGFLAGSGEYPASG
ncbi:MAG: hypothetical protein M1839_008485 [Geoglossum umbratile]|nr:MAG: hypothetical protein M1839_008485 [Geoglossum umbratile]